MTKVLHSLGEKWAFRIHATYNESIERFLNIFEEVDKEYPFLNKVRWIIDHAETINDKNLARIKRMGGGIAVQDRMFFQFNTEAIYQWGRFGDGLIRAWALSTDLNYTFKGKNLVPSVGVKAEVISGDQNPEDNRLQTFHALYPRGGYFGLVALIGPANLMDLHPSFTVKVGSRWELDLDWDVFWLYSLRDGIYFPSGRLNQPGGASRSRFIGHQFGCQAVYHVNRFLEWEASLFYFKAGDFIRDIGEGASLWQSGTSFNFRF